MASRRSGRKTRSSARESTEWIPPIALFAASFAWNLSGGGFPWSLHPDEASAVRTLGNSVWDAREPALLAHLGRLTATSLAFETPSEIASTGRFLSALFGSLSVLLLWRILRDTVSANVALFGAGVVALSPLLIQSAHYFTVDCLLLALLLSTVLCLARFLETGRTIWVGFLGVSIGLAVGTHYSAILLVLLCVLAPKVARSEAPAAYWRRLGWTAGLAALTFVVINPGLLRQPRDSISTIWGEASRAIAGDHLYISAPTHWFSFHLTESLAPAVTTPVLLTSLLGLGIAGLRWARLPTSARLTLIYAVLLYVLAELSPLKPYPDSVRYVLGVLPALGLTAGLSLEALTNGIQRPSLRWLPLATMIMLLAFPSLQSLRIIGGLGDDTRQRADLWSQANAGRVLRELHASVEGHDVLSLTQVDLAAARRAGVTHIAASSFVYNTFATGSRLADQKPYVYERHERYQELFEYPYEEFTPTHPALGWSNPTIRIIDIRKPPPPGRP